MRRLKLALIMAVVLSLVVAAALVGCESSTQTSASDKSKAEAYESETSKEDAKIQSAMSAAPTSIAKDARIVDYPEKVWQPLIELREGNNGWTCFPDWQATPGKDPMCFDEMWMQWFEAINTATDPNIDAPGIAYMLDGIGGLQRKPLLLRDPVNRALVNPFPSVIR